MIKTALIAIGGNSLITDKNHSDIPHQWDAVRETCRHLADMIDAGWRLIITHGNGPQVGFILRRGELAANEVHTTPLDLIVADTQGSIGYMLQQGLKNELRKRGKKAKVVTVVTQMLVNADDPAFQNPTKPIGSFMDEATAQSFAAEGWDVVEDAGRGWRRVVASPKPFRAVELDSIKDLISADNIVIVSGGGGIPVVADDAGNLSGVNAVIDKDFGGAMIAREMAVDLFLISTGVEKIAINFGKPTQKDLDQISVNDLTALIPEGHFAPGSMLPKVQAVADFVSKAGKPAVITDPSNIARALKKEAGTWITP
ncbi:MAG TPA: carbamate kinase [Anaerolineae bacterium]|nr:carbamate kinase [Anaerolineae bacterium]